ncbi:hypothetical protein F503_08390 [Ophiostoma piceae UAMH 11346]|uniref:Uncharacterized protein n=1 Tax=Ophiostoma piceae (strain UAMH 11346) TaxID=1262450 RepID=S3BX78_OPHP1|nr:hypothetical protein F503_08390 [Ophiostoma piceae UAMH 11346]
MTSPPILTAFQVHRSFYKRQKQTKKVPGSTHQLQSPDIDTHHQHNIPSSIYLICLFLATPLLRPASNYYTPTSQSISRSSSAANAMPPIPIYSQSPINADTADGVTPKTAAGPGSDQPLKNPPATTTSASSARYAPPPPQPGAAPSLPEPTGVVHAATATTKTPKYSPPPPPQPGAVPVPPRTSNPPVMYNSSPQPQQTTPPVLPPPPKAGETLGNATNTATATATSAQAPAITAMPPQMAMPPLTSAPYPGASRGTATAAATTAPIAVPTPTTALPTAATTQETYPAIPEPTGAFMSQEMAAHNRALDHPPGYVQNAYATDMNSSQREAALTASSGSGPSNTNILGGSIGARPSGSIGEETESLWDAAKKLAASVGEGLKAGESEVWRRINKE